MTPTLAAGFWGIEHFTPPWDVFYLPLFNLLVGFYHLLFSDFALAIIVFTIVIRTILAPLFIQQIRSQKEMQRMQPLIREVQRKHKGNRAKAQEETMALYKEHGVNPASGCLPVVFQLPILWALYQALIRASNIVSLTADQVKSTDFTALQQALPGIQQVAGSSTQFIAPVSGPCNLPQFGGAFGHFLPLNCQLIDPLHLSSQITTTVPWLVNPFTGIHLDLAQPDHAFAIPILGFGLSFIAVIAAILQFVQVKMTQPSPNADDPTSSATSTMTYLFPLLTIFWGGLFASGLILYWVVYTGYLVIQQYTIMGWGNLFPLFGWTPPFARNQLAAVGALPAPRAPRGGSGSGGSAGPPPSTPAAGQRADGADAQGQPSRTGQPQTERRPGGQQRAGGALPRPGRKKRGRKR
jgi:YidC/Oxa1 family membrane protein insertase